MRGRNAAVPSGKPPLSDTPGNGLDCWIGGTPWGDLGRLLRREGLYSSHLTTWRRARRETGPTQPAGGEGARWRRKRLAWSTSCTPRTRSWTCREKLPGLSVKWFRPERSGAPKAAAVGPMTGRPLGPTSSVVAKHGRPVVVVMAVEEYERLKFLETGHVDSRLSTTGKAE